MCGVHCKKIIGLHSVVGHGLVFLLEGPICKATKSTVFPLVLFMLLGRDGLGREGDSACGGACL